jgi:hypothetical protein
MREETLDGITYLIIPTESNRNESYQLPAYFVFNTYQKRVSLRIDTYRWYRQSCSYARHKDVQRKWSYSSTHSYLEHEIGVSDQPQASATLPAEK